jgi:hypothetical protein
MIIVLELAILSSWAHFKAMTTNPGYVEDHHFKRDDIMYEFEPLRKPGERGRRKHNGTDYLCSRHVYDKFDDDRLCGALKVKNVHHCSTCERCVYFMDHHCIWVGNCVGRGNLKFFF